LEGQCIFEITVKYNEEMFRDAFKRHYRHGLNWKLLIVLVLSFLGGIGELVLQEPGPFSLIFFLGSGHLVYLHIKGMARAVATFRTLTRSEVEYYIYDKGISAKEEPFFENISWRMIVEALLYDDMWIFYTSRGWRLILPTEVLTDEIKELIRKKLELANVDVFSPSNRASERCSKDSIKSARDAD